MAIRAALFSIILLFAGSAFAADEPLTSDEVKHWIETEIEVVELQMDYKANAAEYEDVIAAFFAAKADLVTDRSYASNDAYDARAERIYAAVNAMEEQERLEQERAERAAEPSEEEKDSAAIAELKAMIRDIEESPYLTPEQKEESIAAMEEAMGVTLEHDTEAMQGEVDAAQQAAVDATKADWPAVEPWIEELNHLTDWAAGNRPDAPVIG
ncbi:hypothetical protein FF098_008275 [Parvularcula flava]|uniref:Uncharacterized protein n=1 Tax=Aquisalinus luteolus TaxID=1566827 RepID=A0A8J3A1V4_9PROT|nr:hypothetical protein [Aquisalinus luteolus]NHK27895.1 hypothetical protein [Aquisalinus luteolus]GGH96834.1 hypothetical protein GCM10011355_16670 [Aquisalinus luteolus]